MVSFTTVFDREAVMRKKGYRPDEVITKLREADILISQGRTVAEAIKALSVSDVTYYRWRQEYGGMSTSQAKRLKELEQENARLRKAVSDLTLDKLILQEAARGNF
jgi:transposase-like protein